MHNEQHILAKKIEAILLFINEPIAINELITLLNASVIEIRGAISELDLYYKERGICIVSNNEKISFGTNPEFSSLIEAIQKDELSRDIGKAGLETLAIVLYKGPVSRKEIDYIRGVNSGSILRNLLIRGLVEREEREGEKSFSYSPTLKLLEYLGVKNRNELPEFDTAYKALVTFVQTEEHTDENTK